MSKSTIWISYDLGVRGDYENWYTWLDQHKAKECVDNLALLTYEYSGSLLDVLKTDLAETIEVTRRTRMYVIYRDPKTKKMKGHFVFGGRRLPPWSGFSHERDEPTDDEF